MKPRVLFAIGLAVTVTAVGAYAKKNKAKEEAAKEGATPAPAVVAYVGEEAITAEELDKAAANQLIRLRQQEFDIKQNALEALIQNKLLDREAAARNLTVADLLKAEIEDRTAAVTKEEVDAFYEQNRPRLGNRTREDAGPDIERSLQAQKQAQRRSAFFDELSAKSEVKVLLQPPRMQISVPSDVLAKGPENAPVTIIEYSDYQCPFCRRAHPTVEQVLSTYGDKIRFIYRDYPLNFHQRAVPASIAARCAGDQGKFWEYHTHLMEQQGDLSDGDLAKRASALGLDQAAFEACTKSGQHEAAIRASFEEGAAVGVTGTPAFFVNGRSIVGALPFEAFKTVIDDELSRAGGTAAQK